MIDVGCATKIIHLKCLTYVIKSGWQLPLIITDFLRETVVNWNFGWQLRKSVDNLVSWYSAYTKLVVNFEKICNFWLSTEVYRKL